MKHRFLYIMALLLTVATGAWADDDPAPISLTSSADGTVWTLSTMPEYDVELEVTYKTDLTLTVSLSGWTYGATANTLNFTGLAQELIVAGSVAGGIGTMQYSLDGTTWSTDIPTGTDEGTYTVHYKVVGDGNHNDVAEATIEVTIGAALDIDLTSTDGKTWTLASMPYYDVELEVEYYPAATLTTAPTSIGEVYATGSARRQHQAPTSYGIRWLATPRIATARLLPHA